MMPLRQTLFTFLDQKPFANSHWVIIVVQQRPLSVRFTCAVAKRGKLVGVGIKHDVHRLKVLHWVHVTTLVRHGLQELVGKVPSLITVRAPCAC
jgi:hypothetical protein